MRSHVDEVVVDWFLHPNVTSQNLSGTSLCRSVPVPDTLVGVAYTFDLAPPGRSRQSYQAGRQGDVGHYLVGHVPGQTIRVVGSPGDCSYPEPFDCVIEPRGAWAEVLIRSSEQ